MTIADLVHLGCANISRVTNPTRDGVADGIGAEVANLFHAGVANLIVDCTAFCFRSLNFIAVTGIGNLVSTVDGFKVLVFKLNGNLRLVKVKKGGFIPIGSKCRR